jgi:superfamily I DNA/RNA helicase
MSASTRVEPSRAAAPAAIPRYRLRRTPPVAVPAPVLDPEQRRVVDHRGGPLLVLAGPGTGKTTTLVEAVVDRVERGGPGGTPLDPSRVLVLTFSRKAAEELRTRITARLGRTTSAAVAWTFHGFCYALVRAHQPADWFGDPMRLLSGPEQHAVVRELLTGAIEAGTSPWPADLEPLLGRRGFVEEVRRLLARVRQLGLDPADLAALAGPADRPDWAAAAAFCDEYLDVLQLRGVLDYGELIRAASELQPTRPFAASCDRRTTSSSSTSTRTRIRRRSSCCTSSPAMAGT